MWTPDVYEGAPTPVTALMAAGTKAAAIVVTLRVLVTAFPEQSEIWSVAVAVLAVASLVIGNLAALVQRNVKRMLAYSSVAQAGFLLTAVAADNAAGAASLLFFLVPYTAATVGAFAVIAARERELERPVSFDALAGLGWERPLHGVAMWVFVLSFAGFPLTGGFLGKLTVFSAVYEAGWWWLVVVGVVATAVSIAYYLAVVRAMYMRPSQVVGSVPVPVGGSPPVDRALDLSLACAVVVVVGSFFAAGPLYDLAEKAAAHLLLL
jgi:NADH-quinone oxidoreductase subunit N